MIAIIKYKAGNVQSVQYALQRLGAESVVTDDEQVIRNADKVIFPGVGEASSAMRRPSRYWRARSASRVNASALSICARP